MRRRGLEPMHDEHINVTPLIDVVMCLIIFFLCCTTLVQEESKSTVQIPRAQLGQELADERGKLLINLVPFERDQIVREQGDNTDALAKAATAPFNPDDRPVIYFRARQISLDELPGALRQAKADNPDLKVILRADEALDYKWISPILVACQSANISSVNFSTRK